MFSEDFIRRIMWKDLYTREYAEERRECITHAMTNGDGVTVSCQRLSHDGAAAHRQAGKGRTELYRPALVQAGTEESYADCARD